MDEQAASFVRNLMRDVAVVDNKGKKIEKHSTYSELIAIFISNPTDISNNKGLKRME
jgi:predicted GTPase